MEIKLVSIAEIARVMEIITDAKRLLSHYSLQWQQGYPNETTMKTDIENNNCFGAYKEGRLVGVVSLVKGLEMSYERIENGSWFVEANVNDLVIHRIAVKEEFHHQNIGSNLLKFAIKHAKALGCKSVKVDTYPNNKTMQYLLLSNNFSYRGIIYLRRNEVDNARLAYELILN